MTRPPRPPLVFRIGIVGHRPNRLTAAHLPDLKSRLAEIIVAVKEEVAAQYKTQRELYDGAAPVIRALSPLAEGVDRLFAECALAQDCELTVVTPFVRHEFENDFVVGRALEPDSIDRFRELISQASRVFELDGSRTDASTAYHVAGDVVLNQSDLLIVVWDGERKNLRGGTEETFDDAIDRGVPIVWIDAHAPHHWRTLTRPLRLLEEIRPGVRAALTKSHSTDQIRKHVRRLLQLLPGDSTTNERRNEYANPIAQRRALDVFLSERQPRFNFAIGWKVFRNIVGDNSWRIPRVRVVPYEADVELNWPRDDSQSVADLVNRLRPYYAWSDKPADRYADAYRSAFIMAFGLAAFAVAMALAPLGLNVPDHSLPDTLFAVSEAVAICLILLIVILGRRGHWHRRWLDYRLLAEIFRHQRLVAPLGGQRASPAVPAHWADYGDAGASWMAWYARAVERWLGLPSTVVDRSYLEQYVRELEDQLGGTHGQILFHQAATRRADRIEHRLHRIEVWLLAATLICCLQHIAQSTFHAWLQIPGYALTFCCGFFPALGAALAGINNQGEFRRVKHRSRSMAERLEHQLTEVEALKQRITASVETEVQMSPEVSRVASDTARMMVNEVLDWRIIFQDQPLRTT